MEFVKLCYIRPWLLFLLCRLWYVLCCKVDNAEKVKKVEEYAHFAKEKGGTWPPYGTIGGGTVLSGPTEANTSTCMTIKYEEVGRIAFGLHLLYTMSGG